MKKNVSFPVSDYLNKFQDFTDFLGGRSTYRSMSWAGEFFASRARNLVLKIIINSRGGGGGGERGITDGTDILG